jgi:hypothetical protein
VKVVAGLGLALLIAQHETELITYEQGMDDRGWNIDFPPTVTYGAHPLVGVKAS